MMTLTEENWSKCIYPIMYILCVWDYVIHLIVCNIYIYILDIY